MRQLKPDVSHRMRRHPSIFTAPWFRWTLGTGVVLIILTLIGPPIAGWLRGGAKPPAARAPRSAPPAARVAPPGTERAAAAAPPAVTAQVPARPPTTNGGKSAPAAEPPGQVAKPKPEAAEAAPKATAAPPSTPARSSPAPAVGSAKAAQATARATNGTAAQAEGGVFRVQVGAFLDHRNADRLTERLRGDGIDVVNGVPEESRELYRVLAIPTDGGYEALARRLGELGYTPEASEDAVAVTRPLPLASAVETSRRLREQGIRVRLARQTSAAALRVVRVGAYPTAEEAERARSELAARGYQGFVIRER